MAVRKPTPFPAGRKPWSGDGEYVTRGQTLGGNVVAKMDGLAQYRFPRRAEIAYREEVEATLPLPADVLVEQEAFRAGEILAELESDVSITAPVDGTAFLHDMGEDSVMVVIRESVDAAETPTRTPMPRPPRRWARCWPACTCRTAWTCRSRTAKSSRPGPRSPRPPPASACASAATAA